MYVKIKLSKHHQKEIYFMSSFDICKSNWKKILVGSPELLKNGDESVKERIAACSKRAMSTWADFKRIFKTDTPVGFFRTERAVESNHMTRDYATLLNMALGYGTYGTECYQNEELLADILSALEWGYNNYYGKAEMENIGWRDVRQFNWWDWCIGTPQALMGTMIIVDEHLTLEKKRDYLALFDQKVPKPRDYGSNKVHFGELIAQSAILCERPERVLVGRDGIEDTYLYADGGINDAQGFYRDGSYVFHTLHPMNYTYGMGHFAGVIDFAAILAGSEFALKKEHTELLYTWLYKSFLPFCRNGEVFRSVLGRHPAGTVSATRSIIKALLRLYELSDKSKKPEISNVISMLIDEHPLAENGVCNDVFAALTLNDYLVFKEAYKPGGKAERCGLFAFNCMDRAVQQHEKYAFALSISSSRIYNYECINHENMTGWYHGDGMLNLVSSPYKYSADYWKYVDPYRIPGTTANDGEREVVSIAQRNEYLSSKDFVGTLTTGDTGVSVMQLESFHSPGLMAKNAIYNPSGAYGGPQPARECTLTAKKAYFFLDGYAVCLGSAVNAEDDATVYTVIDNRYGTPEIKNGAIKSYNDPVVLINGKKAELSNEDTAISGVNHFTVDHDAYCILDGADVTFKKTEGDIQFVQALVNHGKKPKNGSYAYAVLPFAGATEAESFCQNSPIEILKNSATVQAIKETATQDLYCAFHSKGTVAGLTVRKPLLVSVKGGKLYVCDVTQKLGRTTVTYNGKDYKFNFKDTLGKALCVEL